MVRKLIFELELDYFAGETQNETKDKILQAIEGLLQTPFEGIADGKYKSYATNGAEIRIEVEGEEPLIHILEMVDGKKVEHHVTEEEARKILSR